MVVTNWWHKSWVWIRTRLGVDIRELDVSLAERPMNRVRLPGAGRPARGKNDLVLETNLLAMVTPDTASDPMRPRKGVYSSPCHLRQQLAEEGHAVGTAADRRAGSANPT